MIRQFPGTKVCRIAQPNNEADRQQIAAVTACQERWRSDGILHKRLDTGCSSKLCLSRGLDGLELLNVVGRQLPLFGALDDEVFVIAIGQGRIGLGMAAIE
jgi:hypothetical protein